MENGRAAALLFRVAAHVAIAVLAITLPGVGDNRFWVAGLLVGVGSPLAILINLRVREMSRNWAEALLDLIMVVAFIHLVPHLWMVLMCLGLMIALAPSISLHPASHWIYLGYGVVLLTGMMSALIMHDVSGWMLPMIAVAVTYPSMLYYTYTQMRRHNDVRQRAQMVKGMTELAGSVAHDFNNMLTSVSGHAELARLKLDEDHSARQDIDQVLQGAERASLLSQQLLSFSGRNLQHADIIDLATETRTIAELLATVVPPGTTIKVDAPERLAIAADISQINQILMNLILNAGEAMFGQTGEVHVRLEEKVSEQGNQILISVRDSGPGIPPSIMSRIAEPFFSTKDEGHGIGLAATKNIIDELGGSIHFDSDANGTEVLVTLAQDAEEHRTYRDVPTKTEQGNLIAATTVLVVEDESMVRQAAAGMLEHLGCKAIEACDGFEGVAIFAEHSEQISVVLLDLRMPRKDGWECLRELREISPSKPVIICSGFDPQDDMKDTFEDDHNLGFLKKPYRLEELKNSLDGILNR